MGRKDGDVVMFDGKISAADLIADIISEADIAYPVSERSYVGWLNAAEQLIYSEIIKEQREIRLERENIEKDVIKLSNISVPAGEDNIRFEDIYTVYVGSKQLIKTMLTSGKLFDDTYYKSAENLGFNCPYAKAYGIRILYFARPKLKTVSETGEISRENVCLPPEFTDILRAKLRGEAYKIANEDVLAAKWLNDYNVLIDTFKEWIKQRESAFSM